MSYYRYNRHVPWFKRIATLANCFPVQLNSVREHLKEGLSGYDVNLLNSEADLITMTMVESVVFSVNQMDGETMKSRIESFMEAYLTIRKDLYHTDIDNKKSGKRRMVVLNSILVATEKYFHYTEPQIRR